MRHDGRYQAYPDPGTGAEPWTIGWGSTGPDIRANLIWSPEQCDARFDRDVARFAEQVARAIGDCATTQNQFDALVSFHYNTGKLLSSTLLKRHKAGDFAAAQVEFGKWNKAAGKVLAGLTRRRAAEAKLYAMG